MKKIISVLCLFMACYAGFSQGQFIIGVKGGIDGCFYTFNTNAFSFYNNGAYTKIVSKGPAIPAQLELLFGTKKFRVGYQFEYERILTSSYKVKLFNQSYSYVDSTVYDPTITQHFFCHNLLLEYIAFDNNKNLRIVPDIIFGYFMSTSGPDLAPYNFSALNANRFKFGAALNLEYYFGPYSVVTTPDFTVAPVKSLIDPNEKGYMFFVGLHIGMRFNVTKTKQQKDAAPKKKKKEYVNPEEDN